MWCPDCRRSKQFLDEQRIPYRWVDIDKDQEARAYVESVNEGKTIIPTIVFPDGSIIVEPTNAELAEKLKVREKATRSAYDLIVIGGGPCGLAASLYAAREGIETLVIERSEVGGQAAVTELIENYPGFAGGIKGKELSAKFREHSETFGVELLGAQEVKQITLDGDRKTVTTSTGDRYWAPAVLIATGTRYRRLNVPGESDYIGAGIHFCATCDGPFYKGKEVLVIGGGNSGVQEGIFLTRFASKVTIVEYANRINASKVLQDKAGRLPQIEMRTGIAVKQFKGGRRLETVVAEERASGNSIEFQPAGVFVFIGLDPNADAFKGLVELSEMGFIKTDRSLMTKVSGLFAAGDVREGSIKQVANAVADGVAAALTIRGYLEGR
ncbi:MAG: FAD-dependent oxidoreductase [Chloroflexi bacterium]|nr:FAD-dependent oxidoreductase [Chloroflexota bacterium]